MTSGGRHARDGKNGPERLNFKAYLNRLGETHAAGVREELGNGAEEVRSAGQKRPGPL
jgi:hypothetical protein